MKYDKVYIPVSVEERLPDEHSDFIVIERGNGYACTWEYDGDENYFKKKVTHCSKKKEMFMFLVKMN